MKVLGIGFPRDVQIPTRVTACGDGVHTTVAMAGIRVDCDCNRMTIDLRHFLWLGSPFRVVLVDGSMDGVAVGEIRCVTGRMVRP